MTNDRSGIVRTIARLERITNSYNGNPRYRVTFADGSRVNTAADHAYAYEIDQSWEGRRVRVTLNGRGTIGALELVTS